MADPTDPLAAPYVVARAPIAVATGGGAATAVDETRPMPVASAAPSAATASIASGAALSAATDLATQRLHRIVLPAGWTAAALSFQSSADGTSWSDLYDAGGEVTLGSAVAGGGRAVVVDPAVFLGVRWLKVRSGTAASPVNQTAQRDLTLVTVAR